MQILIEQNSMGIRAKEGNNKTKEEEDYSELNTNTLVVSSAAATSSVTRRWAWCYSVTQTEVYKQ